MADETKKPEDQKPTILEPPKDIEELLKELPKVDPERGREVSQRASASYGIDQRTALPLPRALADTAKPAMPLPSRPLTPSGQTKPFAPPTNPPSLKALEGAAKPPSPPPTSQLSPPTSQSDKFKSLVRTMAEDLEAAKKGIKPESKPFEIKPPPLDSSKIAPPPPPLKMSPQAPRVKLGPAEKTKPLELPKLGPPVQQIGGATPKKFNLNPKILIIALVVLIAAFASAWWFLIREPKKITVSIPTITPTPTPVFPGLFEIFGDAYPIITSSTDNFAASFNNSIKNVSPLTAGKFTALSVTDENGSRYPLSEIFQRHQISVPSGLLENLDPNEWFLVAYGQKESFDQNGLLTFEQTPKIKLGLIAKAADALSLRNSLNGWEITLTNDLKDFFGVNLIKATSETFLDNIYGGANVRYRNFPYADNSIDYAIVNLPQFNLNYFVLTNSRESIYSAIDLLRNQ